MAILNQFDIWPQNRFECAEQPIRSRNAQNSLVHGNGAIDPASIRVPRHISGAEFRNLTGYLTQIPAFIRLDHRGYPKIADAVEENNWGAHGSSLSRPAFSDRGLRHTLVSSSGPAIKISIAS